MLVFIRTDLSGMCLYIYVNAGLRKISWNSEVIEKSLHKQSFEEFAEENLFEV